VSFTDKKPVLSHLLLSYSNVRMAVSLREAGTALTKREGMGAASPVLRFFLPNFILPCQGQNSMKYYPLFGICSFLFPLKTWFPLLDECLESFPAVLGYIALDKAVCLKGEGRGEVHIHTMVDGML
jgi:hypothetical protein